MAGLQELKKRLRSIEITGQLAGAMRTAATGKYAGLSRRRNDYIPYAEACRDMLAFMGGGGIRRKTETAAERDCLVLMSGSRGMCGGFHAELFRFLEEELRGREAPLLIAWGRKAAQYLRERDRAFEEFPVSDMPKFEETVPLADRLREIYETGEADRVIVVRQRFRNMLIQEPEAFCLLPEEGWGPSAEDPPLLLPDRETIGELLAIQCFGAQVYGLALENALGAQAATLTAMRSACDNAETAAAELEIRINRRRQAEVTSGVIETASGNYQ